MPEIVVSNRAREDFKRIWHYIAQDNADAADRVLLALDAKIARLHDFPEIGTQRDDVRPGARTLIHGRYLVLYEYVEISNFVQIVAVVEAQRDLSSLF
jgi:toxin ParE1/3/4